MLVPYVTTQRIAHDLALCLAVRAGERFCLGGQLVGDRYGEETKLNPLRSSHGRRLMLGTRCQADAKERRSLR